MAISCYPSRPYQLGDALIYFGKTLEQLLQKIYHSEKNKIYQERYFSNLIIKDTLFSDIRVVVFFAGEERGVIII